MTFLINLQDFLYLALQFTLIKHAPFKYSIFQGQELQNLELIIKNNAKIWNQFYFHIDFIFNALSLA